MDPIRDQSTYACGDQIAGRYQLLRPIGAGGMGVVWVAHNLVLDVHVAVKLIRGSIAGSGAAARLLREARSAARIAHPGVVRVYDYGTTDRFDPFIVMELLEGETLRDLLEREQRLSPMRAVAYLLPVADALATLADAGIVHRDLKPENVILTPRDDERVVPKLVDFGVAFLAGTDRLTLAGLLVGTPDYLAPEQVEGHDVDPRADVWAFSLVLFEAIVGDRPFAGDTVAELLSAIVEDTAPRITAYGLGDDELAAIIARGLEKSPAARWPSMRAMRAALAAWASAHGLAEDISGGAVRTLTSDPAPSHPRNGSSHRSARPDATTEVAEPPHHGRTGAHRAGDAHHGLKPTKVLPGWSEPPRASEIDPGRAPASHPSSRVPEPIEAPPPVPATGRRWVRPAAFLVLGVLAAALVVLGLRSPAASDPSQPVPATNPASSAAVTVLGSGAPRPANEAPSGSAPATAPAASHGAPRPSATTSVPPTRSASPGAPSSAATASTSARSPSTPATTPSAGDKPRVDDLKDPYKKR